MCRRMWLAVWDSQEPMLADMMKTMNYGRPPYYCEPTDLPQEISDPYIFPYLQPEDRQWDDLDTALSWCREMFADLGLVH